MSDQDKPQTAPRRGERRRPYSGHPWWWWATAAVCAVAILGSVLLLNF